MKWPTYLPHERILGVRLRDDGSVDVHVTAYRGMPLPQLAARIRRELAENMRIDVTIADIVERG